MWGLPRGEHGGSVPSRALCLSLGSSGPLCAPACPSPEQEGIPEGVDGKELLMSLFTPSLQESSLKLGEAESPELDGE